MQVLVEPRRRLFRHAFLHLRPSREELDDAGELRQTEDARAGQIYDRSGADERQQVVLAQGDERDVASDDQLVVVLVVREGRESELARAEQLGVGIGDASWRAG